MRRETHGSPIIHQSIHATRQEAQMAPLGRNQRPSQPSIRISLRMEQARRRDGLGFGCITGLRRMTTTFWSPRRLHRAQTRVLVREQDGANAPSHQSRLTYCSSELRLQTVTRSYSAEIFLPRPWSASARTGRGAAHAEPARAGSAKSGRVP
jgi:hypothetical protein